jgi:hypothetical protein
MGQHDAFEDLMSLIQQAAVLGDLPTIEKLTRIAGALKPKPSQDAPSSQTVGKQPVYSNAVVAKTVGGVSSVSTQSSRKARGKSARAEWLSQRAKSGVLLTQVEGRVYETAKRARVGIAYAGEQANRPDKWWLGLRDQAYSVIVLLCRDGNGKLLDFVVPSQTLSPFWRIFSRHGGSVEFHLERTGPNYALRVPGGRSVPMNSFLAEYKSIQ